MSRRSSRTAPRLILGSASPRRRMLLSSLEIPFDVVAADIDESWRRGETPRAHALRLAREKAIAVARRAANRFVLAADTIVVDSRGRILGKPKDRDEAIRHLSRLEGRVHRVITAVAVAAPNGRVTSRACTTRVTFRPLSAEAIRCYAETGEGDDKAGAYALQGLGALLVERIDGDWTNVVGLPLGTAVELLVRAGAPIPSVAATLSRNNRRA